jgi:CubicO group peptidase (beta-lactamase class C family)
MPTITDTAPSQVADLVQREMERWSVPGMTVGVLHDGRVEAWGFGVTTIDTGYPVLPDTLFQIGSITKVFTTTLIMRFVDEGRLDLDTPMLHYLPDFALADPDARGRMTLRLLLSHQTGFYGDNFKDFGPGDDALAKALAEFHTLRQITPAGALWAYCNTAFQVAGAIIERLTGQTVEQAIAERVLKPLALEHSVFFAHEAITHSAAAGHNKLPGKDLAVARPYPLMRCMNAAGGIIGTVGDLLRFAQFHMGDGTAGEERVLSEAALREMQTPQVEAGSFADHYGIGWALRTIDGQRVVGHGGSTNGFRAQLAFVPARGVAIALLTNGSLGAAANHAVEAALLQRYAGLRPAGPAPITLPAEQLVRLAGRYEQPMSEITITEENGGLRFAVVAKNPWTDTRVEQIPFLARPLGERRFVIVDGEQEGSTIDFIGDGPTPRFVRLHGRLADRLP